VIMMNLNNFQGEQHWKTIWKILKTFVISPTKIILPVTTGYIFQHTLIYFIHTNAMNPFSKLTNGEKVMNSRYKLFILLREILRRHANFSASYLFHPAQNGWFFNTDRFIFNLIYLFVSRHEVHSMNTHTLQNAGW